MPDQPYKTPKTPKTPKSPKTPKTPKTPELAELEITAGIFSSSDHFDNLTVNLVGGNGESGGDGILPHFSASGAVDVTIVIGDLAGGTSITAGLAAATALHFTGTFPSGCSLTISEFAGTSFPLPRISSFAITGDNITAATGLSGMTAGESLSITAPLTASQTNAMLADADNGAAVSINFIGGTPPTNDVVDTFPTATFEVPDPATQSFGFAVPGIRVPDPGFNSRGGKLFFTSRVNDRDTSTITFPFPTPDIDGSSSFDAIAFGVDSYTDQTAADVAALAADNINSNSSFWGWTATATGSSLTLTAIIPEKTLIPWRTSTNFTGEILGTATGRGSAAGNSHAQTITENGGSVNFS